MRMVLVAVCLAAVAAACGGCSSVPGCTAGCGAGGPECQPGAMLWDQYCSGGDVTFRSDCGRMSLFGLLFGTSCECADCDAYGACGGCGSCASGACGAGMAGGCIGESCGGFAGAVGPAGGLMGCAGSACDGRCGGQCPIAASRAAALARGTAGAVGAAVRHVVHTPQRIQNNCANGIHGLAPGPTQGAVVYPYYTTRGPRDFLLDDPPSIGP